MLAIKTILCPTDFSEYSKHAYQVACALARDYRAKIVLLNVLPIPLAPVVGEMIPIVQEEQVFHLTDMIDAHPKPAGVDVDHKMVRGEPVDEIVELAKALPADIIVMGTHGRGLLGRILMGSVAEGVVRASPCPVLTMRSTAPVQES
jgi:nucleotide-binding universal stress UspA family protein